MRGLENLVARRWPGARLVSVTPLGADAAVTDETNKATGYGKPLRIRLERDGQVRDWVLHTITANDFGHDRRADRAEGILLAWDSFGLIPDHARALDVGAVTADGELMSLADSGELYLLTEWVPGTPYADDLRRVAASGIATPADLVRADELARWLVRLHRPPLERPAAYVRAIRDLIGHGECLFGVVDGYQPDVPGAAPARLRAIEERCLAWRWKLRGRTHRLRRTHGDFHPFNVVFQQSASFRVLDTSRGSLGDPADDVAAMAVNFPFFALERPASWTHGLGLLWHRFWTRYLEGSGDRELLEVVAPFFAWRALVVSCPRFYPRLGGAERDHILTLAERGLDAERFHPEWADELFR
jgi:hypothetical protein